MASSPKIDDLRKKFEENPRRYFAPLANEYRKAGDIEQAIAICREYLPQQPGHMSGHIVYGQALYEARQLDEAKTVFETALSLDPENLIALRHLGDISLMAGDTEAAKTWYKRVLEADPRNEETQAQLASLEAAGKPPAAPTPVVATPAVPETLSTAKTSPMPAAKPGSSSAPTVVMKAMGPPPRPAHPPMAPATPLSPTAEIRLDGLTGSEPPATKPGGGNLDLPKTLVMEAPHGITPVATNDQPVVTQTLGLEATAIVGTDTPAMDSFSLEGLETTSLSAPPPPPPQPATAEVPALDLDVPAAASTPAPPPAAAAPAPPEIDLDFGAPAPPPPPAPVAQPSVAAEAPTLDIGDLGLAPPAEPAPSAPAPSEPAPMAEIALDIPVTAADSAPPVEEIDVSFAPPVEPPVAAAPAPSAESAGEVLPPVMEVEAPAAPATGPFVTETMAELYLQQGHRDEGLRVYRALLDAKPGDAALRAKVESLEGPSMPEPEVGGPTIREILILIALRRPGYRPDGTNGSLGVTAEPEYAETAPVTAAATQWAADTLGALWGSVEPDPAEESAALMLATAFADLNGLANGGAPGLDLSAEAAAAGARPAVAVPAPTAAPSSFSFDKFFSPRVTAEHAAQASGTAAKSESKEDVAQFTRWLEGLKQQ